MAKGGTFRASRGKGSHRAKSHSLQTCTSPKPSSAPTILLQPQCPLSSGTTPRIVSRTPLESSTIVEVGESSAHAANRATSIGYCLNQGVSLRFMGRLRDETGINPMEIKVFERVHKLNKCKGEWCDARAENVHSKYHDIVKEKNTPEVEISDEGIATNANPPLPAPPALDAQAWVNATANNESNNESEIIALKKENASLRASVEQIMKTLNIQQVNMPSNE
ncbi:hypothetical protein Tco_1423021, partial [Tanacetum coccineum]